MSCAKTSLPVYMLHPKNVWTKHLEPYSAGNTVQVGDTLKSDEITNIS
jgi:hypothetical protein